MYIWAYEHDATTAVGPASLSFFAYGKDLLLTLASHKLSVVLAPRLVCLGAEKTVPSAYLPKMQVGW